MSKSKRLLDIWMFVNAKRSFTARELADEFELSIRTIQRYLTDLSELGVPLCTDQGKYGGYKVLKNRVLPPIVFNEDEVLSIFFAYQSLRYYNSLPFNAEVQSVTQKLYHLLSEDEQKRIDRMRHHITFWNPTRNLSFPFLESLLNASLDSLNIRITYESKLKQTEKFVQPIGVYAHNGLWYCPVYDYKKEKILLLRVDRIVSLQLEEESKRETITLEEWFSTEHTKEPTTPSVRLHVLLNREGVRQCRSNPVLEDWVMINQDGAGFIDTLIDEEYMAYQTSFFFTLGTDAEILEPQSMKEDLYRKAQHLMNFYSKNNNE